MVLFGIDTLDEWATFLEIISLFFSPIGMEVSSNKSIFLKNVPSKDTFAQIGALFPYKVEKVEVGFKYLGYFLKPNNYKIAD